MRHSAASANQLIKLSALVIGGIYLYRRFTEGTAEELKASTKIAPLGQFIVAWSVVFLGLSLIVPASPTLAGNMALLVMLASVLSNGVQVSADLQAGLKKPVKEREEALHPHKGQGHRSGATSTTHFETRTA